MLTQSDIADYGQRHVEEYLASTGYHCNTHKGHHGIDIEARGEEENLFVHVVTSLAPSQPPELSTSDMGRVITRAMALGDDSWLAKVQINPDGQLAAEIEWVKLNL